MRIWDMPVGCLCRNHLLAEHRELHAIWNIILREKIGYSRHPEVVRWRGKLGALWRRHEGQVVEMTNRGYVHRSPISMDDVPRLHRGHEQDKLLEPVDSQRVKLRAKGCLCAHGLARPRRGRRH